MDLDKICGGKTEVKTKFGNFKLEYTTATRTVKLSVGNIVLNYSNKRYYRRASVSELNAAVRGHDSFFDALLSYKTRLVGTDGRLRNRINVLYEEIRRLSENNPQPRKAGQLFLGLSSLRMWLGNILNPPYTQKDFPDLTGELERMKTEGETIRYCENAIMYGHNMFKKFREKTPYPRTRKKRTPYVITKEKNQICRRTEMLGLVEVTERILHLMPSIKSVINARILQLEEYTRLRNGYLTLKSTTDSGAAQVYQT
ncbi:hypothetical protein HYX02_06045 [Candidatus Woesearchaeota archaeon]|nr:hypothetical protein [Candidatus Woesearchaeota archaeon]